jgi:hypothetical protein
LLPITWVRLVNADDFRRAVEFLKELAANSREQAAGCAYEPHSHFLRGSAAAYDVAAGHLTRLLGESEPPAAA